MNGYEDKYFAYGIQALLQFSKDVPVLLELLGDRFSEWMFKLNYNMKIYGLLSGKILLYKALEKLRHRINSDIVGIISDELMEAANEWNKICMLVVRSGVRRSKESLVLLSDRIKALVLREERVYNKILACI